MRKATIISVTANLQLEIPPEIQAKLHAGDEFMIWEEGENIGSSLPSMLDMLSIEHTR